MTSDNTRVIAPTVTEWLSRVDYSEDPSYVPSLFALKFVAFIKLVNNGGDENKTPVLHLKMLDQISTGNSRIANLVFRGAAKTTLFAEYLILYIATYGELDGFGELFYALYVSDSVDNGVKKLRESLENRWEGSAFLQQMIPKAKFTQISWEFENADGKKFVVHGFGAQTGVRGTKALNKRPQLAILDDLLSDSDAKSAAVIKSIEATVYNAIDYALHPTKSMVIWSGTPYNQKDPLYRAVESGSWKVNVYPVCDKFPCTPQEFRSAWPDRFTYAYVKQKYDNAVLDGKLAAFNQELMLQIMGEDERVIEEADIQWYKKSTLMDNRSAFTWYITTDFAVTANQASDYSVISVWAVNYLGQVFWVDGIVAKQLMDKNIDDLFRLVQQYNPLSVGIEVSGQQSGFVPWINQQMLQRNVFFHIASDNNSNQPGIRPNTNKQVRFNVMLPWFKQKLMHFPVEMQHSVQLTECMDELRLITVSGFRSLHDDFIDTISMLASIGISRPSPTINPVYKDGLWALDEDTGTTSNLDYYVA